MFEYLTSGQAMWFNKGMAENPQCPDHTAHSENAADRLFPGVERLTADQSEAVDAEAEVEYMNCEGH